ncbi:OmpH/Skp family outer membrane protein [Hydrogenobaculum acidophilum]
MKNLKKMLKATALSVGLLSLMSLSSYAGDFACVDTQAVMQKSTFAKSLGKSLNEKVASIRKKLQAYEAELQNLQKEIESKAISKQAKKQKIKEYENVRLKALEYQQDAQKELQAMQEKAGKEFTEALKTAVTNYAKSHHLEGVFDCNQMLYTGNLDITSSIIKTLDSTHK